MEIKKDFVVRLHYRSELGMVSRWFTVAREAQKEVERLQKEGVDVKVKRFTRKEYDELRARCKGDD